RQNVLEQVPPLEAPPYRTRAVQQLIKGLAWGPPTSRAVWAALESPITATAAPTSTTSLPATPSTCLRPDPAPPVGAIDRSDAGSVVGRVLDGGLDVL